MTREEKLLNIATHDELMIGGFCGDYAFLSNMFGCEIIWMNKRFKSVESAYQASKFLDNDILLEFIHLSGFDAKKLANKYKDKIRHDWNSIRYDIMCQLIFQKFLIHKTLQTALCNTLDRYLEETNYWGDTYFGVYNGVGENKLGEILMRTRNYFMYPI